MLNSCWLKYELLKSNWSRSHFTDILWGPKYQMPHHFLLLLISSLVRWRWWLVRLISVATLMWMVWLRLEATNYLINILLYKIYIYIYIYLDTIISLVTRQNLWPATGKVNFRQYTKVLSWFSDLIRSEMQNLVSFLCPLWRA